MSVAVAGRRIIASTLGTDGGKIGSQRSHTAYVVREGSSQFLKNLIQLWGFRSHRSSKAKVSNPIFESVTHTAAGGGQLTGSHKSALCSIHYILYPLAIRNVVKRRNTEASCEGA